MAESTGKRSESRLLGRMEDWHCVIFHSFVMLAYALAFWLWLNPEISGIDDVWSKIVFVLFAAPLLGWVSGIDIGLGYHNHTHRPIFRAKWLNTWYERIWSPFNGWPAKYWAYYHVNVHHGRLMAEGEWPDWTVRQRKPDGEFESCLRYQMRLWPWRSLKHIPREIAAGKFDRKTAFTELFWFVVVYSIPFLIDPIMGLGLWLLPHWCGNSITMGRGMYIQHAGCEPWVHDKSHPHSVNIPIFFFNATMFNIGYHAEHHDFPGRHWTDLPALHEKIKFAQQRRAERAAEAAEQPEQNADSANAPA